MVIMGLLQNMNGILTALQYYSKTCMLVITGKTLFFFDRFTR